MCKIIAGVLPVDAPLDRLARRELRFTPARDELPRIELAPGEMAGKLRDRVCDCGSAVGSGSARRKRDVEAEISALRRKGWTERRIDRWRAQVEGQHARHDEKPADELREWCDWVRSALQHVTFVGLFWSEDHGEVVT